MDFHAGHPFIRIDEVGHVGKIEARIDAQGVHVHADGHDIGIARSFAIAKQSSFNAVGAGQDGHFGIGHARPPVVVGMDRQYDVVAVLEVLRDVSDLRGKDVRHGHLHRRRQIDDGLAVGRRLPNVEDGVADIEGVFRFRSSKAFRRIFEAVVGAGFFGQAFQQDRPFDGNGLDFILGLMENLLTLGKGRRIIDVDDGIFNAF